MKATQGEHTPGPWELDFFRRDVMAGEKRIAKVGNATWRDQVRRPDNDGSDADYEEIANATLIASAPELLQALEWFADELPSIIRQSCPQGVPMEVARAHERAKAAIAKARGAHE